MGQNDGHHETARWALRQHIPAVPLHGGDGLAARSPIAQRYPVGILVTHGQTRTETERSGQGMIAR